MDNNEIKESLRLLLKLWNEGGKEAVEAFLAMSEKPSMLERAKKILPHIQDLENEIAVHPNPITINGDCFEMTGIDDWIITPNTVESIWAFDEPYLRDFLDDGLYERSYIILRNGHLVAGIPIQDYVPCIEAYLKDN